MKRNQKIIWGIVVFVICFAGSFLGLSYLLRPVTISRKNICGFYAEEDDSLDAVFIGGSDCYTSWQPLQAWNQHGFTSYNFAIDALQPQVIKFALEEIRRTQSPELFVIDLRPFQYGDLVSEQEGIINMERVAPFRNFSDNIKYSSNRWSVINAGAPKAEEKWTYYFDIAKYHSGLYALIDKENWMYIFNEKKLLSRGFECYDEANPISFLDTTAITDENKLSQEVDLLLIDLLEYCRRNDLRVLFLVYAYSNSELDQKKYNYMERIIGEYEFDFLNMNDYFGDIQLNVYEDFHDVDHVNLLGSDKITNFLGKYLVESYHLSDKRNVPAYEQWNIDYEKWKIDMDLIREKMYKK